MTASTTPVSIRPLGPADVQALRQVSIHTFSEAFAADNSEADMNAYFAGHFSEAVLLTELNDPDNQFFFAEIGGEVAGYAKLRESDAPHELSGHQAIELERIYVLQAFQKQKVGAALLQYAIDRSRLQHKDTLWLGVWEHNHKALNFYTRWGFQTFGSHVFTLGNDDQTDLLMQLDLKLKIKD